ncbi:MAG: CCA tRNA nucleotidyltransferase [Candidatus Pacebacteria bacterium]|nr:CCA tRNA nucleotidyltransferase [Candidatus Paceibacterota bacterium]
MASFFNLSSAAATQPLNHLSQPSWLTDPLLQPLLAALDQPQGTTRFVGGCVRDWLLQLPFGHDIDLATQWTPDQVTQRAEAVGFVVIPSGIAYGTVTVLVGKAKEGGWRVEITTLRRDDATDGRHATVSWLDSWAEDAARRDLTMNAIYCDCQGNLYDPLGGIDDLQAGLIRFIGNPQQRIIEDHLRILRYFRFLAWYGKVPPLSIDLAAAVENSKLLTRLSVERLWNEFKKLLLAPEPCAVLVLMVSRGILKTFIPEIKLGAVAVLARLIEMEEKLELPPSARRRIMALLPPNTGEELAKKFKLSKADQKFMAECDLISTEFGQVLVNPCHYLRHYGSERVRDASIITLARADIHSQKINPAQIIALTELTSQWEEVDLPISGEDILAHGIPPGKRVGEVFRLVEVWWEAKNCQPNRAQCLEYLSDIIKNQELTSGI